MPLRTSRNATCSGCYSEVNGVGAKLALTILSGMDAATFSRVVSSKVMRQALSKLPGIGKKNRGAFDHRNAATDWINPQCRHISRPSATSTPMALAAEDPVREAVSALISLGFKPPEASRQVHAIEVQDGLSHVKRLCASALKTMVR